jgi:thiol-disulfide isomerase/thioredoxin
MKPNTHIHIEIIHQGDHCPSCQYMADAVEEVIPEYDDLIRFTKIEYMKSKRHARRFYELSVALYGEEGIKKRLKCAPIPSLFINGELVFDSIPPRHELVHAIETALETKGIPRP